MSRICLCILVTLTGLGMGPAQLAAQSKPVRAAVSLGLGGGGSKTTDGAVIMGQLTVQKQPHHAGVRGLIIVDPFGSSGEALGELSAIYGRSVTGRFGYAALATGAGIISADQLKLGIPVVAEGALSYKVIGIGAQVFANLNAQASYMGLALFLQIGWLP